MKILFVCTGNTCRSPMAEGIFRSWLHRDNEDEIMCQSAGISAINGDSAAENAIKACEEIGVNIAEHIARRITPDEIPMWDTYFTMSKTQAYILEQGGVPIDKIYVAKYIDDPFGGDIHAYRTCRDKLTEELGKFYIKLKYYRENTI